MLYTLLNSLFNLASGRTCRSCGEPIAAADAFGMSEGVCSSCRA